MKRLSMASFLLAATLQLLLYDLVSAQGSAADYSQHVLKAKLNLLDSWLQHTHDHKVIPGISITLFNKDSIIWENDYGYADQIKHEAMTANTPMRSCSISKLFTALAVMRLDETGRLSIDDPLGNFLPWFKPQINGVSSNDPVTIKSVLTHTSGLPTEADIPYFVEIDFPDRQQLIKDRNSSLLLSETNTEFRYSNLGYAMLGLVIEKVTGMEYNHHVQQALVEAIGLETTWTDLELLPSSNLLARGYGIRSSDHPRVSFEPYSTEALSPAAGLITSSHDLGLFGIWALKARQEKNELFRASTIREMMSPVWDDTLSGYQRGLGFRYYQDGERTYVGHGGYCSGYRSVVMLDTLSNMGVSVMINVNDESPYDIAFTAMGIMGLDIDTGPGSGDWTHLQGIYDRPQMPERVVISALPDRLLVLDLFSARPDKGIWELKPTNAETHLFEKVGEPVEAALYFSFPRHDTLFHRYYNYLIKQPGPGH